MFSKILVATNLSKASSMVIKTLGGLKGLGTKEAKLIHCLNIRDVGTLADSLMKRGDSTWACYLGNICRWFMCLSLFFSEHS